MSFPDWEKELPGGWSFHAHNGHNQVVGKTEDENGTTMLKLFDKKDIVRQATF